jgi:hypothetical protein
LTIATGVAVSLMLEFVKKTRRGVREIAI